MNAILVRTPNRGLLPHYATDLTGIAEIVGRRAQPAAAPNHVGS